MPAVTVDDILVLPRVADPDPATQADRPSIKAAKARQCSATLLTVAGRSPMSHAALSPVPTQ